MPESGGALLQSKNVADLSGAFHRLGLSAALLRRFRDELAFWDARLIFRRARDERFSPDEATR